MSSWRGLSRPRRRTSSAGGTILCSRRGWLRVILRDDACSSTGTTMAARRAGTFPPMRALLERVRGLDPLRADAFLAALFLLEAAVELAIALPPNPPDVVLVAFALVAMGAAIALRRQLPLTCSLAAWSVFLVINALPGAYNDHLVSAFFVMIFLSWSVGRHADDQRALIS